MSQGYVISIAFATEKYTWFMSAYFRWLVLLFAGVSILVLSFGPATQPTSPIAMLPSNADSTKVAAILDQQTKNNSQTAIVLFQSESGARLDPATLAKNSGLGAPIILNEDGSAAMAPVTITTNEVAQLRKISISGVKVQVTGPAAIKADLAGVFDGANVLLLAITGIIVAVLLIVTYRSPVLWLIPLLVIGLADRVAAVAFTWVLSALGLLWNESTTGIISVLVFGAGTNYALLLISRYRDELNHTTDRFGAMSAAWWPTMKTVFASGMTVIIGVCCLLLSAVPTTRGLGLAAVVGIIIAFCYAMFVLPGVLLLFGRWIFWPRIPQADSSSRTNLWLWIGTLVSKKPLHVTVASLVALGISSIGALQIHTGLSPAEQFTTIPESISVATELSQAFPEQNATPAVIATKDAEAVSKILPTTEVSTGEWSILETTSPLTTPQLRERLAETTSLVGGQAAELYDAETFAAADRLLIFPLILVLIFLTLVVLLRCFLAPLIMTATVLITNIAALGIGWWISTNVFGFTAFDSDTPLYAFVFLVALGIDYSIFLITRTQEETTSMRTKDAVLQALSSTGGVITSAGILLAAVFAALGALPLVVLAQIGIVIFAGVLLDTLVVRTILIPAIVQLLGERFWWPARRLPLVVDPVACG